MLSDQDKATVKGAAEQLCRKGAHNPDEAAILFNFCQLAGKLLKEEPKKEATGG